MKLQQSKIQAPHFKLHRKSRQRNRGTDSLIHIVHKQTMGGNRVSVFFFVLIICNSQRSFPCAFSLLPVVLDKRPSVLTLKTSPDLWVGSTDVLDPPRLNNDALLAEEDLSPSDIEECTKIFLDETNYPPGTLSTDILNKSFPVLNAWGKTATLNGAQTVQDILNRLEKEVEEVKGGNSASGDDPEFQLTNWHYTVAVDAWGKSGVKESAIFAENLLNKMENLAVENPLVAPNRVAFNTVIQAYAKQGNAKKAASILSRMERSPGIQPITNDYNALLGAYVKRGEARNAEKLVKRMVDICRDRNGDTCDCAPDLYSYNMLLDAWAKSGERGASKRAEEILQALQSQYEKGDLSAKPDIHTYTVVICCVARSGSKNAAGRAQAVFDQALESGINPDAYLYASLLDAYATSTKPGSAKKAEILLNKMEEEGIANSIAYNTVIKAWKGSTESCAAQQAAAVLERMENRQLADTISYTTVIAAYANKGDIYSAQRADEICQKMEDFNEKDAVDMRPNIQTYNTVMNAWVRSGKVRRAEEVLNRLQQRYEEGSHDVMPNVVSYSTVMNGWAKSSEIGSLEKTEELFQKMNKMYEKSGRDDVRPNQFSFVTLINAITNKSRGKDSAFRAQQLLFQMFDEYSQNGNKGTVKPNTQLVASVMDCWQRSGERDAGERAEELLEWLITLYQETNDDALRPNEFVFSSAISAWAKSRVFGKAVRARSILERMVELNESGVVSELSPNVHCYTAVINSCAFSENEPAEKRAALQIALKTFKESIENVSEYDISANDNDEEPLKQGRSKSSNDCCPNQITYATMILAMKNLLPTEASDQARDEAIGVIFKRCCMDGYVDEFVIRRLQQSLSTKHYFAELTSSSRKENSDKISNIFADMEDLPSEWRRNVALLGGKRKRRNQRQECFSR